MGRWRFRKLAIQIKKPHHLILDLIRFSSLILGNIWPPRDPWFYFYLRLLYAFMR